MRIYAIGDIHGQLEMLRAAHARIEADRARVGDPSAPIVHLGDLVDRGPDSCGVIDYLIDGLDRGERWIVLSGNHDQLFLDHLDASQGNSSHNTSGLSWMDARMGGRETLASYGINTGFWSRQARIQAETRERVPEEHHRFLRRLPLWHETRDLLFVHAGIRPGLPLQEQRPEDLVWIRGGFLEDRRPHPWLIVHGHTPVDRPEHYGNRVNLDTGAGYGAPMTAAVFEGRKAWVLTELGRAPLEAGANA